MHQTLTAVEEIRVSKQEDQLDEAQHTREDKVSDCDKEQIAELGRIRS
jgi:hypothetical protein